MKQRLYVQMSNEIYWYRLQRSEYIQNRGLCMYSGFPW